MNVDPQEVKKFDDMALDWWDKEGHCKPLHDLNPLRLAFIQSHAPLNSHTKVVDIGCGGGILTEALSHFGAEVWGIDQSTKALDIAREHAKALKVPPRYEYVTAEEFAQRHAGQFDVVTCMEMLEHVPSPLSVISACAMLLKPGGHLFFSTLNRTAKAFLFAIIGAEYVMKMLPRGTHDYERFIRPSELAAWSRDYALILKNLKGVSYQPFSKTYTLSDDVSVNYLMHFEKDDGL